MPLLNIFSLTNKKSVTPNIDMDEFRFDNKNRPLTRLEVKYQQNGEMSSTLAFTETELDLDRASLVVSYINQLYPFLDYAVVYDEKREWLRYDERPTRSYKFTKEDVVQIRSTKELNEHMLSACRIGTAERQSFWHVLQMQIPEWPQFKQALSLFTTHNQADGLSHSNLLTKFNQLYISNIDLTIKPDPIQFSPFYPALAMPKAIYDEFVKNNGVSQSKQMPLVTKITGDTTYKCKPNELDSYLIHLQPGNFYSKIQNTQCSFTANAAAALVFGAYAYVHGDIKQDEKWRAFTMDLRVARDVFEKGTVQNLDLTHTHIGQNYAQYFFYYAGDKSTNLLQVATAFQDKCIKTKQNDQDLWWPAYANLTTAMEITDVRNPSSFFISNLGRVDFGQGPLVQQCGGGPSLLNSEDFQFQLTYAHTIGGKHGCVVAQHRQLCISEEKQKAIWRVMTRVHEMNREVGPEKVTVEAVISVMEEEFAKIGEK